VTTVQNDKTPKKGGGTRNRIKKSCDHLKIPGITDLQESQEGRKPEKKKKIVTCGPALEDVAG